MPEVVGGEGDLVDRVLFSPTEKLRFEVPREAYSKPRDPLKNIIAELSKNRFAP